MARGWQRLWQYRLATVAVAAMLTVPAWSQEVPSDAGETLDPGASSEGSAVLIDGVFEARFGTDWSWRVRGPLGVRPAASVAVHPTQAYSVAFTTEDGEVWFSVNGGRNWDIILNGLGANAIGGLGDLSDDESIRLGVEARLDEISGDEGDDLDASSFGDVSDVSDVASGDALPDVASGALDELQNDLDSDPWFIEADAVRTGVVRATRPRVWWTSDGTLVVARVDGLWVSRDEGGRWERVFEQPVTAFAEIPSRGLYLLGTADGVWDSTTLDLWLASSDGTEGQYIFDLVATPSGGAYAGTESGLWEALNGREWWRIASLDEPVLTVAVDQAKPERIWVAIRDTVLWSDNAGGRFQQPLGAPMPGVRGLLWLGADHLLAASADGAWESADAGAGWRPFSMGLSSPLSFDLAVGGPMIWLAGDDGLYWLGKGNVFEGSREYVDSAVRAVGPEAAPVGALIGSSISRRGIRPELRRGRRWVATMLPRLQIDGRYNVHDGLRYSTTGDVAEECIDTEVDCRVLEGGTTRLFDRQWMVMTRLTWTPQGRRRGDSDGDSFDGTTDPLDLAQDLDLTIFSDGEVLLDDGSLTYMADARVSRGNVAYRSELVERINTLARERAELVASFRGRKAVTLQESLSFVLRVEAIDGELDAITDGAASTWMAEAGASQESP